LRTFGAILLVVAAVSSIAAIDGAQSQTRRIYSWVDENGKVQYGDRVPPQYANQDRDVLNHHGVRVGFEEGEITEAERLANEERERAAEAERQAKAAIARHDRMLLETYLSVDDIEDLRNRRIELLESQIKLTEVYLGNLRKRLVSLQSEASRYKPHATNADAPQIPENLAVDLSRTTASIALYEQTLARTRADQAALRASFDKDIARFRELKGG
jgi:hypothetical protein